MKRGSAMAVELEFDADDWKMLTTRERIARCLLYAEQARRLGEDARAEIREAYLDLARHWLTLAHEIEASDGTAPPALAI